MAFIFYNCENWPSVGWHISAPRQDLGPMGPFEAPCGPIRENYQGSVHLGPMDFHMAFESWISAQQFPRYVPDKFGSETHFIWVHGAHILHTSKTNSNELKNKFHVTPGETFFFCEIDENLNFDLFWSLLESKGPEYEPWGPWFTWTHEIKGGQKKSKKKKPWIFTYNHGS